MMKNLLKKSKKLFTLIFAFALMFTLGIGSAFAAPNSVTIKAADYTKDFLNDNDNAMVMFKTTEGVVIYCMDIDKKPLVQGQTATLAGDADAGVMFILKNGYPNKSYRNNNGMDAYITQMALWWYLSEDKLSDNFKNTTGDADKYKLVDATKKLVTAARSAKDTQVKPSIKLADSSNLFTLSGDGKYYESAYMSANVVGANTYNVTVNGGTSNTAVVDEQGKVGTTFNSGSKFKIRVPVTDVKINTSMTVKVTATGKLEKAKIYKPSDTATYQRVVGIFEEEVNVADSTSLSLKVTNKHICEFTDNKYYGSDGKEVDKKTYTKECNKSCEYDGNKYYGKAGKEVDKTTFENECNSCKVQDGKYYGTNGNEVDKATYDKECGQEVAVPNTGADIVFWIIGLGILAIAGGMGFIIYAGNKNKVKKA